MEKLRPYPHHDREPDRLFIVTRTAQYSYLYAIGLRWLFQRNRCFSYVMAKLSGASTDDTGTTDIPLTENGRQVAGLLQPILAKESFALALTSPLQRASETCRLTHCSANYK